MQAPSQLKRRFSCVICSAIKRQVVVANEEERDLEGK